MLITIVFIIIALAIGVIFGYSVRAFIVAKQIGSAERKAKDILDNAKDKEKEILIKAKEKAIAAIDEVKREESELKHELRVRQERLEKREEVFDAKLLELERSKEEYQKKLADVDELKAKALEVKEEQVKKLEKIAGLTIDEAKEVLFKNTEERIKDELATRIRKLEAESSYEVEKRAKHVIATAMQRVASSVAQETTITSVVIPSEEMKGRIIGKEGRNIKTIERLTGTEIVIDETPNTIWISGYSPIRRHWCRIALEKLILDGRIHPGRIEEAVLEAKTDLARDIQKAGEEAAYQAGVVGLDPKLIRILGRLKYRTSYGQNVLQHSVEVALISKMLAEELGGDVAMCTKGGLLHDIGKLCIPAEILRKADKLTGQEYEIIKIHFRPVFVGYAVFAALEHASIRIFGSRLLPHAF